MKVGFTGTKRGQTPAQKQTVRVLLMNAIEVDGGPEEFHHGDCVGGDSDAHDIALSVGYTADHIHIHPMTPFFRRAWRREGKIYEPLPPLERNQVILNSTSILIATPKEVYNVLRGSGTWYTIRHGWKKPAPYHVYVILPDGSIADKSSIGITKV